MPKWYERQSCPYCGGSFARIDILKRHIAARHPGQPTAPASDQLSVPDANPDGGTPASPPAAPEDDGYGDIPVEDAYAELERRTEANAAEAVKLARKVSELKEKVAELEDRAYRARVEWSDKTAEASRLSIDNRMLEERKEGLVREINMLESEKRAMERKLAALRRDIAHAEK